MALTYASFINELAALTNISSAILVNGDTNFGPAAPIIIDHAEGMIYRDLDLPVVRVIDTSVTLSSGVRTVLTSTTQGVLLVLEAVNLFSSAGTTSSNGTRIPLSPASLAVIDAIYPSATSSNCGVPQYYAKPDDNLLVFGPTPDQAYKTEITATIRPAALSAANSSTWVSQNLPELLIAAAMVAAAGTMRDYGSQADDPKLAQSWMNQYDQLKASALIDVQRMKGRGPGWSGQQPSAIATPPKA